MMGIADLYMRLPSPMRAGAKNLAGLVPLRLRVDRSFRELAAFLEQSQWKSPGELAAWQDEELRRLIRHAYENVPFWRRQFERLRLTPSDIRGGADLHKLPVLTKDVVRENVEEMVARNFRKDELLRCNTSGTTGKPLFFYYEKSKDYLYNDPYIWRYFNWGGHTLGQRRATISAWTLEGEQVVQYNPVRRLLILNAYRLNARTAPQYAEAIRRHRVEFIDGYPTSLELLTNLLRDGGQPAPARMRSIFSHSEYLYDWQRARIEQYWGGRCFDWYAMEERVILGMECEQHRGHHLITDFSFVEFLDDESDASPDAPQRLIATSLVNYAMPMIRYETGDVGRLAGESCPCGRGFPLLRLGGGRKRNYAVARDGAFISVTNIDIPAASEHVSQFQFIQESPGRMQLNVIRKPEFTERDVEAIRRNLASKFGDNLDVEIRFVEAVERSGNNKTPIFIQRMKAHASHEATP